MAKSEVIAKVKRRSIFIIDSLEVAHRRDACAVFYLEASAGAGVPEEVHFFESGVFGRADDAEAEAPLINTTKLIAVSAGGAVVK